MNETVEVTAPAVEKQRPAHWFKPGQSGNPRGRFKGSRNRLADAFVQDLAACWEKHGVEALERCALERPDTLVKTIAMLLPRDHNLNIGLDAAGFARSFRDAVRLLGNEPPRRRPPLPNQKIIEHERQR
jgi:hypothetical protein